MRPQNILKKGRGVVAGTLLLASLIFGLFFNTALRAEDQEAEGPCPKPYVKTISPRAAKPLATVKIRGNRFGAEPGAVLFAPGIKGTIVSWSYKRIQVQVPADAQTGPVIVSSSCESTSNEVHITLESSYEPESEQQ